jgi:hypothetical protein
MYPPPHMTYFYPPPHMTHTQIMNVYQVETSFGEHVMCHTGELVCVCEREGGRETDREREGGREGERQRESEHGVCQSLKSLTHTQISLALSLSLSKSFDIIILYTHTHTHTSIPV